MLQELLLFNKVVKKDRKLAGRRGDETVFEEDGYGGQDRVSLQGMRKKRIREKAGTKKGDGNLK